MQAGTEPNGPPPKELLNVLGDEYAHRVLLAITEEPRSGREIIERTGISKPTVYRRLNRLESLGIVEAEHTLESNGHHHKRFQAVIDSISIDVDADGLALQLQ